MKPKSAVLKTGGTNCHKETAYAAEKAGSEAEIVYLSELYDRTKRLGDYQLLFLPGGFGDGDAVASGKILATELVTAFLDELREFVEKGKPVLGICNGFQVLVRTGILPFENFGNMDATLSHNDSGKFQCEMVELYVEESACIWTRDMEGWVIELPIAHGEGKFIIPQGSVEKLDADKLVPLTYTQNPNGSFQSIAGITNKRKNVLGLMPHPERFIEPEQHKNWRRGDALAMGLEFFKNGVRYAAQM